jgi:hypothetical protein
MKIDEKDLKTGKSESNTKGSRCRKRGKLISLKTKINVLKVKY